MYKAIVTKQNGGGEIYGKLLYIKPKNIYEKEYPIIFYKSKNIYGKKITLGYPVIKETITKII